MVIAVGSHGRNTGKTSLVCALIRAIPEARWTAVKISGHEHDDPCALTQETDAGGPHDTSRYLRAGAARAYLLQGSLADALPDLHALLGGSPNAILESSRVVDFIRPDLFLFVRNESAPEFKEEARAYEPRANAIVTVCTPEIVERVRALTLRGRRSKSSDSGADPA